MKISVTKNKDDGFDIELSDDFKELISCWLDLKCLKSELAYESHTPLDYLSSEQTKQAIPAEKATDKIVEAQEVTKEKIDEPAKEDEPEKHAAIPSGESLTDEQFAKLDYDAMVHILKGTKKITKFQIKSFAGVARKKFGNVVRDLAKSMNESSLLGILKDPVQSALFVQRVINEDWPEKSDD
jgi:hypothetical protein